jgi:hypothetical protein
MAGKNQELSCQGFVCLAGPYLASEEWMMVNAVADAQRANKETRIAHSIEGAWVWQRSRNRMAA